MLAHWLGFCLQQNPSLALVKVLVCVKRAPLSEVYLFRSLKIPQNIVSIAKVASVILVIYIMLMLLMQYILFSVLVPMIAVLYYFCLETRM
jgi:hypothetical protein